MQRREGLPVVEVDAEQLADEGESLLEHRSREVARGCRRRAIPGMREHRAEHVQQVAAADEVVLDERGEHPLAVPQQAAHPSVGDVRGLGLYWAIELVRDRQTREPLVPFNASLWPFVHFNRLHVAPPLVITEDELVRGLDIIDAALSVADDHMA